MVQVVVKKPWPSLTRSLRSPSSIMQKKLSIFRQRLQSVLSAMSYVDVRVLLTFRLRREVNDIEIASLFHSRPTKQRAHSLRCIYIYFYDAECLHNFNMRLSSSICCVSRLFFSIKFEELWVRHSHASIGIMPGSYSSVRINNLSDWRDKWKSSNVVVVMMISFDFFSVIFAASRDRRSTSWCWLFFVRKNSK